MAKHRRDHDAGAARAAHSGVNHSRNVLVLDERLERSFVALNHLGAVSEYAALAAAAGLDSTPEARCAKAVSSRCARNGWHSALRLRAQWLKILNTELKRLSTAAVGLMWPVPHGCRRALRSRQSNDFG